MTVCQSRPNKAWNTRQKTRHWLFSVATFVALWASLNTPAEAFDLEQWQKSDANSSVTVDHSKWGDILSAYLVEGQDGLNRFRYGSVSQADKEKLETYLLGLQRQSVSALNRDEQFAYWINLYNALTIDVVLDHYPVRSIRDIGISGFFAIGPWKASLVTVEGQDLSLDDIEHKILRGSWKDPRIHYAVNCASIGCPNLQPVPFASADLETMLDAAAAAYVNHPRGARIEKGRLLVSSIYSWFKVDFGNSDAGVLAHLARYADDDLKKGLSGLSRVSGYDYDWTLNEPK